MYEYYQGKTVAGKESFLLAWILGENLLYVVMWILTGYLLWPLWRPFGVPALTIVWAAMVVIVQVLLKRHNCSGCYYYGKRCHLGWGKIASTLCKQDCGNRKVGMKLSLFYVIPPPVVFVASLVFAIFDEPGWSYWCALMLFVLLITASFPLRKKGCSLCTMRECCSGSAAKNRNTQQ